MRRQVRVKWCGKSAPRAWRHERQGKPRREQNRIGATRGLRKKGSQVRLRIVARVGCSRRPATAVPEEWPSRARFAARHTEPGLQAGWRFSNVFRRAHGFPERLRLKLLRLGERFLERAQRHQIGEGPRAFLPGGRLLESPDGAAIDDVVEAFDGGVERRLERSRRE